MDKLPTVNAGLTQNVSQQFDKADAQLQKARKKRKARKKIKPEHIQQVKQGKTQSVAGTQKGVDASKEAQGKFDGSSDVRRQADTAGRGDYTPQMKEAMAMAVAGGAVNFTAPTTNVSTVSGLNNIKDANQLESMFSTQQAQTSTLTQALQSIGQAQTSQVQQNRGFSENFKKFDGLMKSFDVKEKLYNGKAQMFSGLSNTLNTVAQGVTAASTALQTAATSVEAAASACAAIPYVGAALSAVLRAVAVMLKGIATALKGVANMLRGMSQKMAALGKKMQGIGQQMKTQSLANKAKSLAEKAKLDQGMSKLKQIQDARVKVQQSLGINQNNLSQIAERMQALGRKPPTTQIGGMGSAGQQQGQGVAGLGAAAAAVAGMAGMAAMSAGQGRAQTPTAPTPNSFAGGPGIMPGPVLGGGGAGFSGGNSGFGGGNFGRGRHSAPAPQTGPTPSINFVPSAPISTTPSGVDRMELPGGVREDRRLASSDRPIVSGRDRARGPAEGNRHPAESKTAGQTGPKSAESRDGKPKTEADKKREQAASTKKSKETNTKSKAKSKKNADHTQATRQQAGQQRMGAVGKTSGSEDNASDIRKQYEAELKSLTDRVFSAKGGKTPTGGSAATVGSSLLGGTSTLAGAKRDDIGARGVGKPGGQGAHGSKGELTGHQSQLAQLYNKIAEEGVEIGEQIERNATLALEGSDYQPSKKINVARSSQSARGGQATGLGNRAQGVAGNQRGGLNAFAQMQQPGQQAAHREPVPQQSDAAPQKQFQDDGNSWA